MVLTPKLLAILDPKEAVTILWIITGLSEEIKFLFFLSFNIYWINAAPVWLPVCKTYSPLEERYPMPHLSASGSVDTIKSAPTFFANSIALI